MKRRTLKQNTNNLFKNGILLSYLLPRKNLGNINSWELFILRHQKAGNLWIHFLSFLLFWLSPIVAWVYAVPWVYTGFFLSGIVGAIGHYIYKDGGVNLRETTSDPRVVFYVTIMFLKILQGRYFAEVRETKAKYQTLHAKLKYS